jgi:hypothetical protein
MTTLSGFARGVFDTMALSDLCPSWLIAPLISFQCLVSGHSWWLPKKFPTMLGCCKYCGKRQ